MEREFVYTGEGLIERMNKIHALSKKVTKQNMREALMSVSDESFDALWEKTFGESYEEFVNKLLDT